MTKEELITLAQQAADNYGLQRSLVCAVIEQESGWNTWAIRYEPAFLIKYVNPIPNLSATERAARSTSWGLMQIMGQVARELKLSAKYLSELCDPELGLSYGCLHLRNKIQRAGGNVGKGLLRYNGGGNQQYDDEVLAKVATYKHLDR